MTTYQKKQLEKEKQLEKDRKETFNYILEKYKEKYPDDRRIKKASYKNIYDCLVDSDYYYDLKDDYIKDYVENYWDEEYDDDDWEDNLLKEDDCDEEKWEAIYENRREYKEEHMTEKNDLEIIDEMLYKYETQILQEINKYIDNYIED